MQTRQTLLQDDAGTGRISVWRLGTAACLLLLLSSCGSASDELTAVHNTMVAMGMSQSGAVSEGSLEEGATATLDVPLVAGQCYTFVAFGTGGAKNVDLVVADASGNELGRDATLDVRAATQVCPSTSGQYQVAISMAAGSGSYKVSYWSGGVSGGPGAPSVAAGGGNACANVTPIEFGARVSGDTRRGASQTQGSCGNGTAAEQVFSIEVTERVQVSAVAQTSFDGVLYLMRACGDPQSEIVCNDDAPNTSRSQVDATLEPGTYFIVVDGYGTEGGEFHLEVTRRELQSLESVCSAAEALTPGRPVSASTADGANYFQAGCAGGARSADKVYTVAVAERSRVRVTQQSDHDGALHMRRTCADPQTEIACNDDFGDQRHSMVNALVDPGTYYVFADGFGNGNTGNFTVSSEVAPAQGAGTSSDACQGAEAFTEGSSQTLDTFTARDDLAGSCGGQGAADVVRTVRVRKRSRVRVTVTNAQFAGAVYLRSRCADDGSEVACQTFTAGGQAQAAPGRRPGRPVKKEVQLAAVVLPGEYAVVVDGQNEGSFGSVEVKVQVEDIGALERDCRRAPQLRPGRPVTGDTSSAQSRFEASCAGGAKSNDNVYRLRVPKAGRVKIKLSTEYDGALHLRRACADPSTEVACNDDGQDNRHSEIDQELEAGDYFVIVDGFRTGNQGSYTLEVELP